jgi:segregation and condensation protein B
MEPKEIKQVVEALLLVSDVPLTLPRLKELLGRVGEKKVAIAVEELKKEYAKEDRSFTISEVAEGYLLSTLPQYSDWVKRLYKGRLVTKLSKPALETLSIIAFKQPITRPDIEALRGVDVGGVLSTLLERKLIAISGRDNSPGKPLIYVTTKEFLRYFGLNKLSDLPRPRELEELLKEREQEQIELFGDEVPVDDHTGQAAETAEVLEEAPAGDAPAQSADEPDLAPERSGPGSDEPAADDSGEREDMKEDST